MTHVNDEPVGNSIQCPCGVVLRAGDEAAVIATARSHASEVHDMDLSEDDARAMVRPT